MAFKFESLQVWQLSVEHTVAISKMVKTFPSFELYSLCSQIRRAADSVVLNIAEGCTGQSNAEFSRFLSYSMRSGIEVVSCLFIARKKNNIDEKTFSNHYHSYEILCKKINKLKISLN
ncbi:MAG: four helix bundle protein [Ferruginibacter sp.]